MSLSCDVTSGSSAVVYHSPRRGTSVVLADDESHSLILPASEGRTAAYSTAMETHKVEDLLLLPQVSESRVSEGFGIRTQVRLNENDFHNPDECESTYERRAPLRVFQNAAAQCGHMFKIKTIATALPAVVRGNGLVAGHFDCNSVDKVLKHTNASSSHVVFASSPKWAQALTDHDPQKRPFRYMSEANAVMHPESGQVTHYRIPRSEM